MRIKDGEILGEYFIAHHGIKGMKWGVRRYQNADGSLTSAGKSRYGGNKNNNVTSNSKSAKRSGTKRKTSSGITATSSRKDDEKFMTKLNDELNKAIDEDAKDPRHDEMSEDYEGPSENFTKVYAKYQRYAEQFYKKYGYA